MTLVVLTLQTFFTDRLTRQSPVGSFDDLFVALARPFIMLISTPLTTAAKGGNVLFGSRRPQSRASSLSGRAP